MKYPPMALYVTPPVPEFALEEDNSLQLIPARNSFGYDKLEFVTREPLKKEFMASVGQVPPSGDWLDKTYRYMVTREVGGAKGALEVFWEPRKWEWCTLPYKAIFNPSRAGFGGWQTWEYLTSTIFSWLSNARIRRLDTKLDFCNTLAEVLSSVVLKGAKQVFIDPRYPKTIYIGEFGGVQLVIYDKGLQTMKVPDVLIRVEIRQWFETDNGAGQRRPFMMNFMRGDLAAGNPFRNVAWIDPGRLDPQVRAVAEVKGLNYAMLPASGLDVAIREKTRRQIWNHGSDDLHQLYLTGAERWHGDFVAGLNDRITTDAEAAQRQAEINRALEEIFGLSTTIEPDAAVSLEQILFGEGAA